MNVFNVKSSADFTVGARASPSEKHRRQRRRPLKKDVLRSDLVLIRVNHCFRKCVCVCATFCTGLPKLCLSWGVGDQSIPTGYSDECET